MNAIGCLRPILQLLILGVLAGCSSSAEILYVHVQEIDEEAVVEVGIDYEDAGFIKRREVYAYIVVTECDGNGVRFPIEPWVSGQRVSEFVFPVEPEITKLSGGMPMKVFESYRRPCAALEGGSYYLGKITSASVPIDDWPSSTSD
ncbi:hypothetical protein QFW77_15035 [Luteimonas sp. RD2P54]|uniref:Uncharacterized protein n=1 Tax=Luteimonas endophytica TaxID=3042023 RepID=A0ABT6JBT7_9GAMM|nr:hypothetical protein [Luteimonas endophytica]MDH5824291.1 hypothetical protein [Luteimonas endophytica]